MTKSSAERIGIEPTSTTLRATTVLKTARATRHPSLSGLRKTPNAQRPTSNGEFLARETRFEVRRLDAPFEMLNAK